MIFLTSKLPDDYEFSFSIPFEELTVAVDGAELNALHFKQPNPRGIFFFLHGNFGNLKDWTAGVEFFQEQNYDVFIFDYRGYGKSTGEISSQAQLHQDVKTVWDKVIAQYPDKPKVIYGRSLGTSLAAKLASEEKADMLILVSPFTSMLRMAQIKVPYAPTSLLRYPLRTDQLIADINMPTFFIGGSEDFFTPISHAEELKAMMQVDTDLLVVEGADHANIHEFDSYKQGLAAALPDTFYQPDK